MKIQVALFAGSILAGCGGISGTVTGNGLHYVSPGKTFSCTLPDTSIQDGADAEGEFLRISGGYGPAYRVERFRLGVHPTTRIDPALSEAEYLKAFVENVMPIYTQKTSGIESSDRRLNEDADLEGRAGRVAVVVYRYSSDGEYRGFAFFKTKRFVTVIQAGGARNRDDAVTAVRRWYRACSFED